MAKEFDLRYRNLDFVGPVVVGFGLRLLRRSFVSAERSVGLAHCTPLFRRQRSLSVDNFVGMPGWFGAGDQPYQIWMTICRAGRSACPRPHMILAAERQVRLPTGLPQDLSRVVMGYWREWSLATLSHSLSLTKASTL
jgi:hypothetical protein